MYLIPNPSREAEKQPDGPQEHQAGGCKGYLGVAPGDTGGEREGGRQEAEGAE